MEGNRLRNIYKIVMLVILVAFVTFLITSITMYSHFTENGNITPGFSNSNLTTEQQIARDLARFREIIDQFYMGEIDEQSLREGAIRGFIGALDDKYTEFISAEDMREFMQGTMGNFTGIGIYMVANTETNQIVVLSPIRNTPAEAAGLLPGDIILTVDGEKFAGDQLTIAASRIQGEIGTIVKLEILRGEETLEFEIKRERITINPVEGRVLKDNIGYIQFASFDENTAEDFRKEFESLKEQGITSLIIDVRNNGGGLVDQALNIASFIADKDSVLLIEVNKRHNETIRRSTEDPIVNMPVIILANGNTASASEILAGALKDLGKARIVGTRTFGKGVIQQLITLRDGSGLKITSEEYFTPNRNRINKVGIEPDYEVELPETVTSIINIDEADDTQLQKAIQLLRETR